MYVADTFASRSAGVKRPRQSFVERVHQRDSATYCMIKTHDNKGRACWFELKTDEIRLIKLKCTLHEELIDLTTYGEVIDSGWG